VDYRQYPILYVDDEPDNLRIFELTFRSEFEILTAADASSGLEVLNQQRVAVVLSDHRMPGMTGVEFLSAVHQFDESTIRILVTAYGDVATLESAINSGSIYRFVPKPWTPEDMRVTLRNGIERFALAKEREELLRELTLLNRISKSMNQQLASEPLLDLLLTSVIDDLGYDAAGILLFDKKNKALSWGRLAPQDSPANRSLASFSIESDRAPKFVQALRNGESQTLSMGEALELEAPIREWVTEVAAEGNLCRTTDRKERHDRCFGGRQPAWRRALFRRPPCPVGGIGGSRGRGDQQCSHGRRPAPNPRADRARRPARNARTAGGGPRPRDQQPSGFDPHLHEHGAW
jgi:CheY-like chemotaxis protein